MMLQQINGEKLVEMLREIATLIENDEAYVTKSVFNTDTAHFPEYGEHTEKNYSSMEVRVSFTLTKDK